jgi:hypothetical protein
MFTTTIYRPSSLYNINITKDQTITIHTTIAMSSYRNIPLYGGAVTCDLPKRFADVRSAAAATTRGASLSILTYS